MIAPNNKMLDTFLTLSHGEVVSYVFTEVKKCLEPEDISAQLWRVLKLERVMTKSINKTDQITRRKLIEALQPRVIELRKHLTTLIPGEIS